MKVLDLSDEERQALFQAYKNGKDPIYGRRCHAIWLKSDKSEPRSAKKIAKDMGVKMATINNWIKRYEKGGISELKTKPGQGRKPILTEEEHAALVREYVQKDRQRLKLVKEEISQKVGKDFHVRTLKRFLKDLAQHGNVCVER